MELQLSCTLMKFLFHWKLSGLMQKAPTEHRKKKRERVRLQSTSMYMIKALEERRQVLNI